MLAEIITIGDEILIGQIVDTNSAWMAAQLNKVGIKIKQISSVSDDRTHILKAFNEAAGRANIILITGGLGPTKDDITKKTLAEYFGAGMVENAEALENVMKIFARSNRPLLDINRLQAMVPDNCEVIVNHNGTAPGMWFNSGGKVYVSMPGVPFEMMYMMEEQVIPKLQRSFQLPSIVHRTLLTAGEGESFLAKRISDIEDSLPEHIKLAYLPRLGQVRLRLSGYGDDASVLTQQVDAFVDQIATRVADVMIAAEDIALEKAIMQKLERSGATLSIAESCTGGYIAHLFTQHPGASKVFEGGAVVYSNGLKQKVLGVKADVLEKFGAVSEETVKEMVLGALKQFDTTYAIAVTGIAGPDGGTPEKPVGTVWIAVASATKMLSRRYNFGNKRIQNIERSAIAALTLLNNLLRDSK